MRRFWLAVAAASLVSACSGNPWIVGDDNPTIEGQIPAELLGDLESVTYNPANQTLVVNSISLDNTPIAAVYTRKPALDRPGYEAYTTQDASLQRHSTAYVRQIDGTRAAIVVTGGQFRHYFGGGHYARSGPFIPPSVSTPGGLVSYAGNYIGLLNIAGDGGDLLPVAPGTDPDILPVQAAEVVGDVLINADFADNQVNGVVYNRVVVDDPTIDLTGQNIELAPTTIEADGTFTGDAQQDLISKGSYGGVFGGTNASAVAGTLFVEEHINGIDNIDEYGLFVLAKCGEPGADPVCNQPVP